MSDKKASRRGRRVWALLACGIACVVSVVCLAVPNGGTWVDSGHNDCGNKVCAEWEITAVEDWAACCIDGEWVGSSNVYACESPTFRHYHGGP